MTENTRGGGWIRLTTPDAKPFFMNMDQPFGMLRINDKTTRIWSGAISSVSIPNPHPAAGHNNVPVQVSEHNLFHADVQETPEQIFTLYMGRLPEGIT